MAADTSCPDRLALNRLMLGELPETEAAVVGDHLLQCARCAETIDALPIDDSLVVAMRAAPAAAAELPSGAEVEALIARVCRSTSSGSSCDSAPAADQFDFLSAPAGAGEIGRLGPYRILRVLGAGGMGIVFLAEETQLKRRVALKCLQPALAASPSARQRFLREAQAAAGLAHDHIVTIHQVGEDRSIPFLAMQYLDGETLEDRLRRTVTNGGAAPLPIADALRIGREIAEGLSAAHERGLIHRDIKPANIWLEAAKDRVKILDFGLARPERNDEPLTQTGGVAGTPQYMAPEQAAGGEVDHRCDLFGLGCVLYRMATGSMPFPLHANRGLLAALARQQPVPPRKLNPEAPAAFSTLILQLLARTPERRPASARAVVETIQAIEHERDRATPTAVASRRLRWSVAAALLLGVAGFYFGPAVYRIATNQGVLVIETHTPDVTVVVKQNGEEISLIDAGSQRRVTLRAGQYEIELADDRDDVRLSADRFSLSRGGETQIEIRREPLPAAPPPAAKTADELRCISVANATVRCVAFGPNGRSLLAGCDDGVLRQWDADSGKEIRRFQGHSKAVVCLAISPDGRRILSGGEDGALRLWDAESAKELARFDHPVLVKCVAFAPDGRRALCGTGRLSPRVGGTVHLWDLEDRHEIRRLSAHRGHGVYSVAFAPDGDRFLFSDGRLTRLWETDTGRELPSLVGHESELKCAIYSPDGNFILSAGQDRTLRLWEAATGRQVRRFLGHTDKVFHVAFTADGRRALSCGLDQTIRFWDVETGKELHRFMGHAGSVNGVAIARDGQHLVSGGSDKTVRLWRLP